MELLVSVAWVPRVSAWWHCSMGGLTSLMCSDFWVFSVHLWYFGYCIVDCLVICSLSSTFTQLNDGYATFMWWSCTTMTMIRTSDSLNDESIASLKTPSLCILGELRVGSPVVSDCWWHIRYSDVACGIFQADLVQTQTAAMLFQAMCAIDSRPHPTGMLYSTLMLGLHWSLWLI